MQIKNRHWGRIIFCILAVLVFSTIPARVYALEEITLTDSSDTLKMEVFENADDEIDDELSEPIEKPTIDKRPFREKVHDIFEAKIEDHEHIEYLMDSGLTKEFEKGPLADVGIWALWRGALNETFTKDDRDMTVSYDILETRLHGDFRNKKTSFVITTRYLPQHEFKFMQNLFSDTFIRHRFNKHAVLTIGNTRTHTGEEGSASELLIPFFGRSQISRQYGNIRKLGVRLSGDYSLMEYDLAYNSSGTYFTSFFPGSEFCGWVNFKPLGKTDGKYGQMKIGGGLTAGKRHTDYTDVGAYASYKYKRVKADFEIANGDGSNGRVGLTNTHSRGYYTTLYYDLTKKIQLVARFDEFTPNCHDSSHKTREYSSGINYYIKGQSLKLMLNYVFREDSIAGNSHRIIIGTQILL